jgi:pimeloyl-ACP methyl ester carboxylesterase
VVNESLTLPASVWQALFAGFLADDQVESLARITAPTVVVWGDRDVICPRADQDTLLRTIPGATLVVVPDAGHAVHWEYPSAPAEALAAFAAAVDRAATPGGPRSCAAC